MAAIRWLVLLECLSLAVACSIFACNVGDEEYCPCIAHEIDKYSDSEADEVTEEALEEFWKVSCAGCSLLTSLPPSLLVVTGVASLLLSR